MSRRSFVVAGLAAVLLAPQWAGAQQAPVKIPRVGILTPADNDKTPIFDAFRLGLRELGYAEGRNIILEFRATRGDYSRFPQLAADLVALPVDVIVTDGGPGVTRIAMHATKQIPIVNVTGGNPVLLGLVASLSHPGGNVTGFTLGHSELNAKRLDLLRTAFPEISALAILFNPSSPTMTGYLREITEAARSIGLPTLARIDAGSIDALLALHPTVFSSANGVLVLPDGMFWNHRRAIVDLVNAARLPAIYPEREYADDGGLMAYGANVPDNFRRAADYVDRILRGAKPADLPIQEPAKFDFVVNLKTARELGLTIPPLILASVDEVIE